MILGMAPFTLFHVVLSVIGIGSGLVALRGWLFSELRPGWTAIFLITTLATTITGFLFPITAFTPAIWVGIITTAFLLAAIMALYVFRLSGKWCAIFLIASTISLYFNVFVLVVQMFQKIDALNALAPNGTEPPFAITQGIVLLAFATAGYLSLRRFRPAVG
ncbi:hypothetical protein IB238_08610 [Rhizobium sp. ARZ01]|uniref:hypothetical protein n=1 Tax=Rhizobium sp. ARZ01 TaxID=2769313 RepID=UPI001782734D|nr:hypothetical protein [Rhizobium sp. ARZ01]MBD9372683.1 hypothetical protein [Rhizobium sp. ARZ01]